MPGRIYTHWIGTPLLDWYSDIVLPSFGVVGIEDRRAVIVDVVVGDELLPDGVGEKNFITLISFNCRYAVIFLGTLRDVFQYLLMMGLLNFPIPPQIVTINNILSMSIPCFIADEQT